MHVRWLELVKFCNAHGAHSPLPPSHTPPVAIAVVVVVVAVAQGINDKLLRCGRMSVAFEAVYSSRVPEVFANAKVY